MTKIELNKYSSMVCIFSITDDNTIMAAKVSGQYGHGSQGNLDGQYIFSQLVAHYFIFEPITLVLDFSDFDYQWGNTILKSLNIFFEIGRDDSEKEKIVIIVLSDSNYISLSNLLNDVTVGNRFLCKSLEEGLAVARQNVSYYLGD